MCVPPSWAFVMQPVCDTATLRVHHHEMLFRNLDDLSGHGALLEHAEATGYIQVVDFYAMTVAIDALREDARLAVSVNVSSFTIEHMGAEFLQRIACSDDVARRLTVEMTETRHPDMASTLAFRDLLRRRGFAFSIDDFGPGCGLGTESLRALQPDEIKLSGCALRAAIDGNSRWLDVAMNSGVPVVAECIDSQEKLAFVRERGIHRVQGYIIYRR